MSIFSYNPNDESVIDSCVFENSELKSISVEDIFTVESKWKDWNLLYITVQAYAAAPGWKATLSHSIYIKCSCYERPIRSNNIRKFLPGSLSKKCTWEIKIWSTQNDTKLIKSGISKGKYKSYLIVDNGVNVIISKANPTRPLVAQFQSTKCIIDECRQMRQFETNWIMTSIFNVQKQKQKDNMSNMMIKHETKF